MKGFDSSRFDLAFLKEWYVSLHHMLNCDDDDNNTNRKRQGQFNVCCSMVCKCFIEDLT